jgi:hypothetical protein
MTTTSISLRPLIDVLGEYRSTPVNGVAPADAAAATLIVAA